MQLYYSPNACSLAIHILLREAGLPVELVRVDLASHRTEHGQDFYTLNPMGQVPLLQLDDGRTLGEGAVIARYLAQLAPDAGLMPARSTTASAARSCACWTSPSATWPAPSTPPAGMCA